MHIVESTCDVHGHRTLRISSFREPGCQVTSNDIDTSPIPTVVRTWTSRVRGYLHQPDVNPRTTRCRQRRDKWGTSASQVPSEWIRVRVVTKERRKARPSSRMLEPSSLWSGYQIRRPDALQVSHQRIRLGTKSKAQIRSRSRYQTLHSTSV